MARALESVEGVRSVEVSYPEKKAIVRVVEGKVAISQLTLSLSRNGFAGSLTDS